MSLELKEMRLPWLHSPGGQKLGAFNLCAGDRVSLVTVVLQAARNCLVNDQGVVKVSDFGLSRWVCLFHLSL